MPTRVLHVLPAVAPRYGGPSTAAIGMCRALRVAGIETLLATTDADGPGGRLPVRTGAFVEHDGIPAIFFRRTASESFKYSARLGQWLRSHVAQFDAVHIHAVFSHSSLSAAGACRLRGVPYIVRPLGTLDPWSLNHHRLRKQALLALGGRRLLREAARVHYTSDDERRLAEQALPGLPRGCVVPLGIDDSLFMIGRNRPVDSGSRRLLALCRLHEKKRIDLLISAFHAVADDASCAEWSLVIAGDGDEVYVRSLRRLAAEGPARGRIEFFGWASPAERQVLLAGAALFALPSHQENFGIAVAEALAAGVPAIVSPDVNLAGDIAAEKAGWVSASSRDALAATLRMAMGDGDDRRARGVAARRLAERFQWPMVAAALRDLYAETVH